MRKKFRIFVFLLSLVAGTTPITNAGPRHTFHTSLMQIEYNEGEKLVEISVEVFSHDLENILSSRSRKRVRLDKTPDAAKLTLAYLLEAVNLKNKECPKV
jgi:uncharacterized protein DUF6702